MNFKKTVDRRRLPEWRYKERALRQVAEAFRIALRSDALDRLTFVPVPPSKAKEDPLYDDRMTRMLRAIRPDLALDVRELIVQTVSAGAAHISEERPSPDRIESLYEIDERQAMPVPEVIALVDDVLTTGAHYRAA